MADTVIKPKNSEDQKSFVMTIWGTVSFSEYPRKLSCLPTTTSVLESVPSAEVYENVPGQYRKIHYFFLNVDVNKFI